MGGDLGPSMFIGSEAETEGVGGLDLPMKIISCHLFPKRKTGFLEKNWYEPREAIRPSPPPPLFDRNYIFYFLHVAGLAIILSRDNW